MMGCRFRRLLCVGFAFFLAFPFASSAQVDAEPAVRPAAPEVAQRGGPGRLGRRSPGKVIVLAQQSRPKTPSPFEDVPEAAAQQEQKQQGQSQQGQQQEGQQQPERQQRQPASPFEEVPETQPGQQPQQPPSPFEEVTQEQAAAKVGDFIEAVEFRGARRIPRDSLTARIFSKPGDTYDKNALQRDFMVLWNTGYFDDLRLEVEDGERGKIVRFVVVERRIVRTIEYAGNKSATISDILDRFKERRVGLSVESRYDPTAVQRAVVVLKELLGERGRQYAEVTPEVRQIPPSSVAVKFNIQEGPKVKVGEIHFEGNEVMSDRQVRNSMKFLKPLGIPKSYMFESLFARTFDAQKLEADKEIVRNGYQEKGYFRATVSHHDLNIRDATGRALFPLPFIFKKGGKRADITMFLEEGKQYHRGKLSFTDVKLFRTPDAILGPVFQMNEGDIFNVKKLRDGLENLKKLYGEFGYIDFVAEPSFEFRDEENPAKIDLNLSVEEGKQFFVRRINFSGNDTTRDKVIRRELLLDEGDMFNTRLWDLSVLRLNQLGYFEPLKEEDATDIRRDTRNGLVDLTLKVKERGKNTVNLNGGVSGFAGSFIGFGYSTNNFLGLGETLTFETQLGSRERVLLFGFTEPYLFDKPIQAGFTVFTRRFSFNQGREASIFAGQNLIPLFEALGKDNFLDYRQTSAGFTTYASTLLRRSFARVGITYSYQQDKIQTFSGSADNLFRYLSFEGVSGPNSLEGITTSEITPNYFYNTVDHPITPTRGKSLYVSMGVAGFGGNTRFIQPTVEAKWFKPHTGHQNVIAMRALFSFLSGYGGKVPPPFRRSYMGGENDIRGFDIWTVSPMVWIPDTANVPLVNSDGTPREQVLIVDGVEEKVPVSRDIPVYRLSFPGGDTRMVYNFEYRIPLFGPVTVAPFFDIGFNKIIKKDQVRLNEGRVNELNGQFPQAGFDQTIEIVPGTDKVRASTGIELQVMMPVVNAPFRFYWAYNPLRVGQVLQPPIVADRSLFPNGASFVRGVTPYGTPLPYFEDKSTFRFTISRTF
jgi:outer membrane protein insertion porin family